MVKEKVKKHNGNISIWKFIFALLILLHHCNYIETDFSWTLFNKGSIGVEFFFLVSGYLLAAKVYSEEKKRKKNELYVDTFNYIKGKIVKFYPFLIFTYISMIIISFIFYRFSAYRYLYSLVDISLLGMSGIKVKYFLRGTWYLSAMILGMMILYPIMKKYKEKFSCFVGPILAIFGLGILLHLNPSYRTFDRWNGFIYAGMGRALVELTLGMTLFEINKRLANLKFTNLGSILLTITECLLFTLVIIFNSVYKSASDFDWLIIPMLFVGILIGFSEKTKFYDFCNNKVFYYLERLSLPLYLNNFLFVLMVNNSLFDGWSTLIKWTFAIVATIIFSMIEMFILD